MRQGRKSAAQTKAPIKDRIKGSKINKKGSASSTARASSILLSSEITESLKKKADNFNQNNKKNKVSLNTLKAVFRRGAGAFSTSHRPNMTRNGWAYARVNKFLEKKAGEPVKKAYIQDDDLMDNGGELGQNIECINCGWQWNTKDSQEYDKYVCHKCGFDNTIFYSNDIMSKGGLVAPNGNPSNLTPEQYKLVRTPQFKAWFGDWENDPQKSSKVVDDNGEPLVVYHGTNKVFNEFDINKSEYGFFFTNSYDLALTYDKNVNSFFLNIKKPRKKDFKGANYDGDYQLKDYSIRNIGYDTKTFASISHPNTGYDGAFMKNVMDIGQGGWNENLKPSSIYVVFDSKQIKLADGTNKKFDMNNPDIRYKDGGLTLNDNGLMNSIYPELKQLFYKNGLILREDYSFTDGSNKSYLPHTGMQKTEDKVDKIAITYYEDGYEVIGEIEVEIEENGQIEVEVDFPIWNIKEEIEIYEKGGKMKNIVEQIGEMVAPFQKKLAEERIARLIQEGEKLSKWAKELIYLGLVYDLYSAIGNYLYDTDKLVGQIKFEEGSGGSIEISATVERDGQEYKFRTEMIIAGGYNIQRRHYRYIVHTGLKYHQGNAEAESVQKEIKDLKEKIKFENKIEEYEKDIEFYKNTIEKYKVEIANNKKFTDEQIWEMLKEQKDYRAESYNLTWEEMVRREAPVVEMTKSKEGYEAYKYQNYYLDGIKYWKESNIENLERRIRSYTAEIKKIEKRIQKAQGLEKGGELEDLHKKMKDDLLQESFKSHKSIEQIAEEKDVELDYAQEQLRKGMQTESEHSDDPMVQEIIALQHLDEMIDYYQKLDYIEGDIMENGGIVVDSSEKLVELVRNERENKIREWYKLGYKVVVARNDGYSYIKESERESEFIDSRNPSRKRIIDIIKNNPNLKKIYFNGTIKVGNKVGEELEIADDFSVVLWENNSTYEKGGSTDFGKVLSASSRFRPMETINFDPPLVGLNGAKLVSYTWSFQWDTSFSKTEGEAISKRVSDWTQADVSAETGRNIVHKYTIEMPNGEIKSVSSDSVPITLGYIDRTQKSLFPNLSSAAKTLAKQKLQLAILEEKIKEKNNALTQIKSNGLPSVEVEKGGFRGYTFIMGDASCFGDDPNDKERFECAKDGYIKNRLTEMGINVYGNYNTYDLKNRIERQERKIKEILKAQNITYEKGGQIDPDNAKTKDMITHKSGSAGGLLVGNRHSEGGIKAINKSTNAPLEMEGGEVVITRNAVSDNEKREFEGEMLTNREILSKINEGGGGVSFEEGGKVDYNVDCDDKMVKGGDLKNFEPKNLIGKMLVGKLIHAEIIDAKDIGNDNIWVTHESFVGGLIVQENFTKDEIISMLNGKQVRGQIIRDKKSSKMADGGSLDTHFELKQFLQEQNTPIIVEEPVIEEIMIEVIETPAEIMLYKEDLTTSDDSPMIYVGSSIYANNSNGTDEWVVKSFSNDGVNLLHVPTSPLSYKHEDKHLSFDEIKTLFNDKSISIKFVLNERELNLILMILKDKLQKNTSFRDGGLVFVDKEGKNDDEIMESQFGNKQF